MIILLVSEYGSDPDWWRKALAEKIPGSELRVWPDVGNPADVEVMIVDTIMHNKGGFGPFTNLKYINYLGHGVGDILFDPSMPARVQVSRMKSPDMARSMTIAALHAVTRHHMKAAAYENQQRQRLYDRIDRIALPDYRVAVLGLGAIGTVTAQSFAGLGYQVTGWSQGTRELEGVSCRSGMDALPEVLGESDAIIALLPETPQTIGLFDKARLDQMKPGSLLMNLGRGSLIVENDLPAALDEGRPGHAALDVFATEPLPADSPLWSHPAIIITPHAGGPYAGSTPIDVIAENCRRLATGEPLIDLADRAKGY